MHPRSRRGLSTARAALRVARLLAAHPDGVRADEVAEALHKSVSTAYNLLASLCEEGVADHHPGGLYRLSPAFRDLVATGTAHVPELHGMSGVVGDLLARTHKRSYVAVVRRGRLHVVLERGLQGMPKLPGLHQHIGRSAHAWALGKVMLARFGPEALERYLRPGLREFTPHTIADPGSLRAELRSIRQDGFAADVEEFDDDFCSIAAPILDGDDRLVGVIGISMTRRAFEEEHESLARTVVDVARNAGPGAYARTGFQASAETWTVLDSATHAALAWPNGSTVP